MKKVVRKVFKEISGLWWAKLCAKFPHNFLPQVAFCYFFLFHSSNSTLSFSLICSMSECIFASTITRVTKAAAIGHNIPIASIISITHCRCAT